MRFEALLLAGPLLLAAPASAGDLIQELIPADARWVAHVDVEGFLRSTFWTTLRAEPEIAAELDQHLAEAREQFGFDPLDLVKSVTAYGSTENPEQAVAALVVSEAADGLLAMLRTQPMHSKEELAGHAIDVWSEGEGESVFCLVREFEGVSNRLVFLSDSRERLKHGIDVLEGRAQDVTQTSGPRLAIDPQKNSFLFVETGEDIPGLDNVAPVSAIAALAKGLRFEFGEAAGQLFADLRVMTLDAKGAQEVHAVLQGASALLNLVMPKEIPAEVRGLLRGLRFSTNGNQVGIEFRHDSLELVRVLRTLKEMDEHSER